MFFSAQDQRLVGVSSLCFHVPVWSDVNMVSLLLPARGASSLFHGVCIIWTFKSSVTTKLWPQDTWQTVSLNICLMLQMFAMINTTLQVCIYIAGLKTKRKKCRPCGCSWAGDGKISASLPVSVSVTKETSSTLLLRKDTTKWIFGAFTEPWLQTLKPKMQVTPSQWVVVLVRQPTMHPTYNLSQLGMNSWVNYSNCFKTTKACAPESVGADIVGRVEGPLPSISLDLPSG